MSSHSLAQDKPIKLGAFAIGPEDSERYHYGNTLLDSNKFIDRDSLNLKYKFVKFLFQQKDNWIVYTGIKPDSIITRRPFKNFPELSTYDGVGSSHGKHYWDLALFKNSGGLYGNDSSAYTRNFDWAAFYTGAYNYLWTAEDGYNNQTTSYKYRLAANEEVGTFVDVNNERYISNNNGYEKSEGIMAFGPATYGDGPSSVNGGYQQETRHRGSQNYFSPDIQHYKAVFTLRNPDYKDESYSVATLKVVVNFLRPSNQQIDDTVVASEVVYDYDFSNSEDDKPITLSYDLGDFRQNIFGEGVASERQHLSTMFVVESVSEHEIQLKSIEVFDEEMWVAHLSNGVQIELAELNIQDYLDTLNTASLTHSGFFNKLLYLQSVDEPHTFDLFNAHKFVRERLEQSPLQHKPKLFTHYYPEYNGWRGNENAFFRYFEIVRPNPITFYSYYHDDDAADLSMLWKIRTMDLYIYQRSINNMYADTTRFEYIVNVWEEEGLDWRLPYNDELRSTIFTALSFGANAIYYEPVYSYADVESMIEPNGSLTDIAVYAKDSINTRLIGPLGKVINNAVYYGRTLAKYSNTGVSSQPYINAYSDAFSDKYPAVSAGESGDFLLLEGFSVQPYIQLAGLFRNKQYSHLKYFLLNNISGFEVFNTPDIKLRTISGPYNSYSLLDIENPSFCLNYANTSEHEPSLPAIYKGDARLYAYGPTILTGGELTASENVTGDMTLYYRSLTIPNGKNLVINGNYTVKHNISIGASGTLTTDTDGFIFLDAGKTISSANWASGLFKSAVNDKVKLIWSDYLIANPYAEMEEYKIYRKKGTPSFVHIATVSSSTFEYVDTTTDVYVGQLGTGIEDAQYYVSAIVDSGPPAPSNTVTYWYDAGELEKNGGAVPMKVYTFSLQQNYPNPFNSSTKILYSVDKPGLVTLRVYDILGRMRSEAVNRFHEPGEYQINFDMGSFSSGVYIYELQKEDMSRIVKKFMLLR